MLALSAALWLAACEPDASPAPSPEGPRDTLVVAVASDVRNWLPLLMGASNDANVGINVYTPTVDETFDCRLRFAPGLATRWALSDDGLTLDMDLRGDLKWQDGTPLGAEDVRATYALIADPATGSPFHHHTRDLDPAAAPEVVDATHLRWRFTRPQTLENALFHVAGIAASPRTLAALPDPAQLAEHPLNAQPLASGPWKLAKWERGQSVTLEPNPASLTPPRLRRVVFRVLPDTATRLAALQGGTVDLVDKLTVPDADALARANPDVQIRLRGWRAVDFVAWNEVEPAAYARAADLVPAGRKPDPATLSAHPLFGDREVRRALASAIDVNRILREQLTSQVTGDVYGAPAFGVITPALCDAYPRDIVPLPFDPAATRARLGELGWADTNGDGVLDRDGVPFRFELVVQEGNALRAAVARTVEESLDAVGLDVRVQTLEAGTLKAKIDTRQYDAALIGISAALVPDPTFMFGAEAQNNFVSYHEPEASALLERALGERDPTAAAGLWKQWQERVYADQPYAFLYWTQDLVAIHNRFQDAEIDLLSPYRHLERWWVPADRVKYPD